MGSELNLSPDDRVWERPYSRATAPHLLDEIRSERRLRWVVLASLQRDFCHRCCYCTRHETEVGGEENFVVEHFRPRSRFPELALVYSNLYYACKGCNEAKSALWPEPEQADCRFVDPCIEALYPKYLCISDNGEIKPMADPGSFLVTRFRFGLRKGVRLVLEQRPLLAAARRLKTIRKMGRNKSLDEVVAELDTLINKLHQGES